MLVKRTEIPDPTQLWPKAHRQLMQLLSEGQEARDFEARLGRVYETVESLQETHTDDSLFVLVQMLAKREEGYSCSHALLSALLCQLIGPVASLPPQELRSLILAALTMNIGMTVMQDQLSSQHQPLTESQRRLVSEHPAQGEAILRALGVTDEMWISLVADHHESIDGKGYPQGKTELSDAQQLLHMADRFVARISPRIYRPALPPHVALAKLYQEPEGGAATLRAAFAKKLGMYPPGTYVRLQNDETAVVVRRGMRVHTPLAMAIADGQGMPLITPKRRDTQNSLYAVKAVVPADQIRILLDAGRLLKRV